MAIAGHRALVSVCTSATGDFVVWDGVKEFSIADEKGVVDRTTHDPQNRIRYFRHSYRNLSLQLSGDAEPGDAAFLLVRSKFRAGSPLWFEVLLDEENGLRGKFVVESFEQSASVDGLVEFSATASYSDRGAPVVVAPPAPAPSQGSATGGAESTIDVDGTDYRVHVFTSSDDLVVTGTITGAEYLIVGGGGGGGGQNGAGGGAGGLLTNVGGTPITLSPGAMPAVVGAGGVGGNLDGSVLPLNGGNSSFASIVAIGGGNGGAPAPPAFKAPSAGGSGGGGWIGAGLDAGAGTPGQGNDGGNGELTGSFAGGGGGGAGTVGADGRWGGLGGPGGDGVLVDITGTPTYYGGGGAGGNYLFAVGERGGLGGGGASTAFHGDDGVDGLGGGGGGGTLDGNGGKGGSGIVVVRYPLA